MTIETILSNPQFTLVTSKNRIEQKINGLYACDLLSFVMGRAQKGDLLLTILTHPNVLAVAVLLELPCVVLTSGVNPKEEMIKKAEEEEIALIVTGLDTARAVRELYETLSL